MRRWHAEVAARHARMLEAAEQGPPHGTRWALGTAALVPPAAGAAVLGVAIAQGALAANFNVANQRFTLGVDRLEGDGLGAVLAAANPSQSSDRPGVLHAALSSARLTGLCILVKQSLLGLPYTISIGAKGAPATGEKLFFDVTELSATPATLKGAVLGAAAETVTVGGTSLGGAPGGFGLDVTRGTVVLEKVKASAYQAQVAGALTLPELGIKVRPGDVGGC
ncbi:MAG: DUF6230 family protein [Sporichthyaceae bacterium]